MINGIQESISKLFFDIVTGLLRFLYYIEDAFYILAGAKPLKAGDDNAKQINFILESLKDESVRNAYGIFILFGVGALVICTGVAIFKANIEENNKLDWKNTLRRSLQAICILVFMPQLFLVFIRWVCLIMNYTVDAVSFTLGHTNGEQNRYLAQALFQSFIKAEVSVGDAYTVNKTSYDLLVSQGTQMNCFKDGCNFDYLSGLVVTCAVLWAMFVATLGLIERIINLIMLYLIGPVVTGTSPLDDGERYKAWRTYVLSKSVSVFGNIISIYVYIFILGKFQYLSNNNDFGLKVLFYIIAIGGAFTASKGSNLIASIISRDAGNQDGWSQSQTNALLQGGLGLAKGVVGGTMASAFLKNSGAGGIVGGLTNGATHGASAGANAISRASPSGGNATTFGGVMKKGLGHIKDGVSTVGGAMANGFRFGGAAQGLAAGVGATVGLAVGTGAKLVGKALRPLGGWAKDKIATSKLGVKVGSGFAKFDAWKQMKNDFGQVKNANRQMKSLKMRHGNNLNNTADSLLSKAKDISSNPRSNEKQTISQIALDLHKKGLRGNALHTAIGQLKERDFDGLSKTLKKNKNQFISGYKVKDEMNAIKKSMYESYKMNNLKNNVVGKYSEALNNIPHASTKSLNEKVHDDNSNKTSSNKASNK